MALVFDGLAKLTEEMGELQGVVGKKINYMNTDDHPDGKGSLKTRMEDEMADVLAIIFFIIASSRFQLDAKRIDNRMAEKMKCFEKWHSEP